MQIMRRPIRRTYHPWHQPVWVDHPSGIIRGGGVPVTLNMVGPVGTTDAPFMGMDPSDPLTWSRPYRPQPGMISYLNFDGANVNQTQTTGGKQVYVPRRGGRA